MTRATRLLAWAVLAGPAAGQRVGNNPRDSQVGPNPGLTDGNIGPSIHTPRPIHDPVPNCPRGFEQSTHNLEAPRFLSPQIPSQCVQNIDTSDLNTAFLNPTVDRNADANYDGSCDVDVGVTMPSAATMFLMNKYPIAVDMVAMALDECAQLCEMFALTYGTQDCRGFEYVVPVCDDPSEAGAMGNPNTYSPNSEGNQFEERGSVNKDYNPAHPVLAKGAMGANGALPSIYYNGGGPPDQNSVDTRGDQNANRRSLVSPVVSDGMQAPSVSLYQPTGRDRAVKPHQTARLNPDVPDPKNLGPGRTVHYTPPVNCNGAQCKPMDGGPRPEHLSCLLYPSINPVRDFNGQIKGQIDLDKGQIDLTEQNDGGKTKYDGSPLPLGRVSITDGRLTLGLMKQEYVQQQVAWMQQFNSQKSLPLKPLRDLSKTRKPWAPTMQALNQQSAGNPRKCNDPANSITHPAGRQLNTDSQASEPFTRGPYGIAPAAGGSRGNPTFAAGGLGHQNMWGCNRDGDGPSQKMGYNGIQYTGDRNGLCYLHTSFSELKGKQYPGAATCLRKGGAGIGLMGDPHLFGAHGDRTDFKGLNNTWYNFLSTKSLSVNVLFMHDTYNWRRKTIAGSWMKAVAVTAVTPSNSTIKAAYHVDDPSRVELQVDGVSSYLQEEAPFKTETVKLALTAKHALSLSNGEWALDAKNRYLPYPKARLNAQKKRLDVRISPVADVDSSAVAPHGLVGQSFDRDGLTVIGALDNYNEKGNFIQTKAMGEGGIEGAAADYQVSNKFDVTFKFSRFGLASAPPRDVSKLTGIVVPSEGKRTSAGAINDEVEGDADRA